MTAYRFIPIIVFVATAACRVVTGGDYTFHHENVIGTSLELRIDAPSPQVATAIERRSLATIERMAGILSQHDPHSELNRWQRGELHTESRSQALVRVLEAAENWRTRTRGAFDVRAGAFTRLWAAAEKDQTLPDHGERRDLVAAVSQPAISSDQLPISLDALAKGYILDSVCAEVEKHFKSVQDFTINIGGDIRKLGSKPLAVSVADPANATEGAAPLLSFVHGGSLAIATSGGYRRHFEINGRRYSHIIDPRTGFPQNAIRSASVIAHSAMDADAAATALTVMGTGQGLRLIEALDGFECAILSATGELAWSSGWPDSMTTNQPEDLKVASWPRRTYILTRDQKPGLLVKFELNRPKGTRYRRPYVAVWLEDTDGFPVKTAVLWMQTESPGPRWHRDLTRWYRNDRMRQVVEEKKLIGTISGATRGPGEYKARFDGTDNVGAALPIGKYTLCIEAARENGTYQIIREPLQLAGKTIDEQKLKGNIEVRSASWSYIPWKNKAKQPEAKAQAKDEAVGDSPASDKPES